MNDSQPLDVAMEGRTFSNKDGKSRLKGKVVLMYEQILQEKSDPLPDSFWSEFFLLRPNCIELIRIIDELPLSSLVNLKFQLNKFVWMCLAVIVGGSDIRSYNAVKTLSVVIKAVAKKKRHLSSFDMVDLLFDNKDAQRAMDVLLLLRHICNILVQEGSSTLKCCCLDFLLSMVTCCENINENALIEFLMTEDIFETLLVLLESTAERRLFGISVAVMLTFITNFRKSERNNQFMMSLSILDRDLALNGYSMALASELSAMNLNFKRQIENHKPSMLASMAHVFNQLFTSTPEQQVPVVQINVSVLLALYEAVHLNRYFITTLVTLPLADSVPTASLSEEENGEVVVSDGTSQLGTNLCASFLSYCSCLFYDLKGQRKIDAARLCLIIWTCITEDQYANMLMQDVSLAFKVPLYSRPMRHKISNDAQVQCRPLAHHLLNLAVDFILSNLMKCFPFDLYQRMLGIVHRIVCFNKKCKVRLDFNLHGLWNALLTLLRFVVVNSQTLLEEGDIFDLCNQVLTIVNLFVTFGDTFLPEAESYDDLYYEILRNSETLQAVCSLCNFKRTACSNVLDYTYFCTAAQYADRSHPFKETARKMQSSCVNIRAILCHLLPKIEALEEQSLTRQHVLSVVRSSYGSLPLKLQENLDNYPRYQERPDESVFFAHMVKVALEDTRQRLNCTAAQPEVLLELANIK
ncbi:hypothetical protein M513_01607 [Trichuris suis]|nr:hypothetical protein M513_01607 [Trichuris suis]